MSSKTDQAYEILFGRISNAEYMAHTFIDEKEIAEELGSSRTPVREAIIARAKDGLLKILPKRGIMVQPFTYQNASDIFQVRKVIEPWLITNYGPALTKEELEREREYVIMETSEDAPRRERPGISLRHHPHSLLMDRCTNQYVRQILNDIEKQGKRIPNERPVTMKYISIYGPEKIRENHFRLLDLMEQGDYAGAADAMVDHVNLAESEYMKYWFRP